MQRQRLDTKQEPKYTETNKTQMDTMKLTRTQQDTGKDNETGKHKGRAKPKTFTFIHLADAFIQSDFQERALQSA